MLRRSVLKGPGKDREKYGNLLTNFPVRDKYANIIIVKVETVSEVASSSVVAHLTGVQKIMVSTLIGDSEVCSSIVVKFIYKLSVVQ